MSAGDARGRLAPLRRENRPAVRITPSFPSSVPAPPVARAEAAQYNRIDFASRGFLSVGLLRRFTRSHRLR